MAAVLLLNGPNQKVIVAIVIVVIDTAVEMASVVEQIEDAEGVEANAMSAGSEDISLEIVDTDAAQEETELIEIEIEAVIAVVTEAEIVDEAVIDAILAVTRDVIQEATQEVHPEATRSTRDTQGVIEKIAVRQSPEIADPHMKKDREQDLQSVPEEETADPREPVDHQKTVALMLVSRQRMAEQRVTRQEVAKVDHQATEKTVLMAIPMDIQMEA